MNRLLVAVAATLIMSAAGADDGLVSKKSGFGATETLDRLETVLVKKGITVFARVSHTGGAAGAGIALRPTELLIFGNPKLGSHFFTSRQTAGIDLPMKALAWEDADGQVWLTYNDPLFIADRHGIADRGEIVNKMSGALDRMTEAAVNAD